jgi:hypothetical protein
MMFERHDKAPGWNRLSSIPFSTPREVRHVRATNPTAARRDGLTCAEIAARFQCTETTIARKIAEMRDALLRDFVR